MIKATDLIVTDEVAALLCSRKALLEQVTQIELELEKIKTSQISSGLLHPKTAPFQIPKETTREFPCKCGHISPSFLERESHIDRRFSPICGRDGELLNGKHIHKDEDIKGEPIKTVKKPQGYVSPDVEF